MPGFMAYCWSIRNITELSSVSASTGKPLPPAYRLDWLISWALMTQAWNCATWSRISWPKPFSAKLSLLRSWRKITAEASVGKALKHRENGFQPAAVICIQFLTLSAPLSESEPGRPPCPHCNRHRSRCSHIRPPVPAPAEAFRLAFRFFHTAPCTPLRNHPEAPLHQAAM